MTASVLIIINIACSAILIIYTGYETNVSEIKPYKKWLKLGYIFIAFATGFFSWKTYNQSETEKNNETKIYNANRKYDSKHIDSLNKVVTAKTDTITLRTNTIINLYSLLNLKNDRLFEKDDLLIKSQKENLKYITGGDSMIRIVPDISANPFDSEKLNIMIYNQNKYPQYDVVIHISDNFKYQLLTKDYPKNQPLLFNKDLYDKVVRETYFTIQIDEIQPYQRLIIYTTNLPNEFKEGRFGIEVKSRNGHYSTEVFYKQWNNTGEWELQDADKFYKNVGLPEGKEGH